jgi:biotin carboxyl carrier protein
LMDLLEASDLAEVEIVEGEESIRLSRPSAIQAQMPMSMPMPMQAAPQPVTAAVTSAPAAEVEAPAKASGHEVTSPMVGTYYASPKPDAPDLLKWVILLKKAIPYVLLKR